MLAKTTDSRVLNVKYTDMADVFIGRPSKWGNPFHIGRDGNRAQVIQKYAVWLVQQDDLMAAIPELIGKKLGCYCAPEPCHGDVLAALAELARFNATTDQHFAESGEDDRIAHKPGRLIKAEQRPADPDSANPLGDEGKGNMNG